MPDKETRGRRSINQVEQPRARPAKLERISRDRARRSGGDEELDKAWSEWETTFDAIRDSIMLLDSEFNVVQANAATSRLLGRPLDEIVGKKCCNLVHGTDEPPEGCPLRKAQTTKKRQKAELHIAEKNMWAAVSVDPILDDQGNVTGAVHTIRDITERKQAEDALRKSEEHYRMLAETMNDGLIQLDENGKYVYVNKRHGEIFGYSPEEIIGRHWTEFHEPDSQEIIKKELANRRKDAAEPYEVETARKDGRRMYVRISPQAIFDAKGKFKGSLAIVTDITDRKKAEDQSLRQAEVLEAINKVLREALTCDTDIEVAQTCLNVAEQLTGSKFGFIGELNEAGLFDDIAVSNPGWETCKMPHSEATRLTKNMKIRGIDRATLREGKSRIVNDPASHPDRVGTPDGHPEITCFLGVPLRQTGKTIGMIGLANKQSGYVMADQQAIEALSVAFVEALMRKRAAQELLDYQARLKTMTSELALAEEHERRRIAAGIHDDIGQKLALAKLELQMFMSSAGDSKMPAPKGPASLEGVCAMIDKAIEDCHSLTFELSNPALYELSFEAAIEQWLYEQVQKKHGIECEVAVKGDPVEPAEELKVTLFRAIREVAVNVVKHAKATALRVSIERVGDNIRVRLADNGAGFAAEAAGAALSMDKTGGFGLFNIKERLEHLGGNLKIESAPGRGTTITLTAPLEQQDNKQT